jgi:hypothetical protein
MRLLTSGVAAAVGFLFAASLPAKAQDQASANGPEPSPYITEPKKTLKDATEGESYKYRLSAYGGKRPYRWSIEDKSKAPPGIDIDPISGTLQGKPAAGASGQESHTFTVRVANASNAEAYDLKTFVIVVKKSTIFDTLSSKGFKLRERAKVDDDGAGSGPAKFDFAHGIHGANEYMTDAALLFSDDLSSHRWGHLELIDFTSSAEAHLSTGNVKGEKSVSARVGLESQYVLNVPFSLKGETNLVYETDQKFKDQRAGPELNLVPVAPLLGMGRTLSIIKGSEGPAISFRWRPSVGAALGIPIRQSAPNADDSSIERIYAKLRADLDCPVLADMLGLDGVYLFSEIEGYRVFAEEDPSRGNHGFLQVGMNLAFTDNVSLEAGLKRGETAPNFKERIDQIYVALGIKF